jgi:hypothetical protein
VGSAGWWRIMDGTNPLARMWSYDRRAPQASSGIELYPIHGFCRFEMPWSRFDHCVIAWGGVMAQAVVAIPLLLWIEVFGYSRFDPIDAVLGILGPYSLLVATFNLLPIGRLDGKIAWGIVPEFINRAKLRNNKKKKAAAGGWRSY